MAILDDFTVEVIVDGTAAREYEDDDIYAEQTVESSFEYGGSAPRSRR